MSTNAATIRNAATEYAAAETARAAIKYGDHYGMPESMYIATALREVAETIAAVYAYDIDAEAVTARVHGWMQELSDAGRDAATCCAYLKGVATVLHANFAAVVAEDATRSIELFYGDPTDDDDPTDGGPDGGEDVPDPWAVSVTIGHDVGGVGMLTRAQVLDAFERVTGCEAYTALDASGMWRGQAEPSTRLEIVCTEAQARALAGVMPELARVLSQQCVMFDARPCAVRFIEAA